MARFFCLGHPFGKTGCRYLKQPFLHLHVTLPNSGMQQKQTQIKTALLGLVLLASLMLKSGHQLLQHHEHPAKPVCEAEHTGNSTHLHDERYNPEHCSICAFLFATPELAPVSVWLKKAIPCVADNPLALPIPLLQSAYHATRLRGPPRPLHLAHSTTVL